MSFQKYVTMERLQIGEVRKPAGKRRSAQRRAADARRVGVGVQMFATHMCVERSAISRWCQDWSHTALHWVPGERRSRLAVAVRAAGVSGTGARRWRCNVAHPAPLRRPRNPPSRWCRLAFTRRNLQNPSDRYIYRYYAFNRYTNIPCRDAY